MNRTARKSKRGLRRAPAWSRLRARSLRGAALAAAAVWASAGCGLFFETPEVDIAEVRVVSVGLVGATAEVSLNVMNPNGFTLKAKEVRYRLSFSDEDAAQGWHVLTEGLTAEEIQVPARDSAGVRLSVPFRYSDVGRALGSLLDQGELEYRLDGDVKFDAPIKDIRVRFDRRGSFVP
jgi:LEA14-like dessication related protein